MGVFEQHINEYINHGIAGIPLNGKKPAVKGWNTNNLSKARIWADSGKHNDANIGFTCGRETGITIVDIDEAGTAPLERMINRCGEPPIITRTASNKHHLWFKHNGEGRRCNKLPGEKVDILGAGLAVAPPSIRAELNGTAYKFLKGGLDELSSLQPIKPGALPVEFYGNAANSNKPNPEETRNNTLFDKLRPKARSCTSIDELIGVANELNNQFKSPLEANEILGVSNSVWKYKIEGKIWDGREARAIMPLFEIDEFPHSTDAFYLLSKLRASHGARREDFYLANALGESLEWTKKRFRKAKSELVEKGYLEITHIGGSKPGDVPKARLVK